MRKKRVEEIRKALPNFLLEKDLFSDEVRFVNEEEYETIKTLPGKNHKVWSEQELKEVLNNRKVFRKEGENKYRNGYLKVTDDSICVKFGNFLTNWKGFQNEVHIVPISKLHFCPTWQDFAYVMLKMDYNPNDDFKKIISTQKRVVKRQDGLRGRAVASKVSGRIPCPPSILKKALESEASPERFWTNFVKNI